MRGDNLTTQAKTYIYNQIAHLTYLYNSDPTA